MAFLEQKINEIKTQWMRSIVEWKDREKNQ